MFQPRTVLCTANFWQVALLKSCCTGLHAAAAAAAVVETFNRGGRGWSERV
jgi:hypothetical protein